MDTAGQSSLSLAFVEGLYADYLRDPNSVAPDWRKYFDEQGGRNWPGPPRLGPSFEPTSIFNPPGSSLGNGKYVAEATAVDIQDRADQLMRGYRVRGHLIARIDPLGLPREPHPELEPAYYGFGP